MATDQRPEGKAVSQSVIASYLNLHSFYSDQTNTTAMQPYADIDRDSGVAAYETGSDYIRVRFKDGSVYLYTYSSAGQHNIERMKQLAAQGDGLNSFINKNVRKRYARKEK